MLLALLIAFACPAQGGPAWTEARTAHFVIHTDLPHANLATFAASLEQIRALLLQAMTLEQPEIPGRLRVIAFAHYADFSALQPSFGGFFAGKLGDGEPAIVVPLEPESDAPVVIAHELAHALSFYLYPVQPSWFAEGLATFFEHVAGSGMGTSPRETEWVRWTAEPLPLKDLLLWNGDPHGNHRYHYWGWLLFHWLWYNRSKQFSEFERRLAIDADPPTAWKGAFPEFDPASPAAMAKLEAFVRAYRAGDRAAYKVQAQSDGRFTETPLSSAAVHRDRWAIRSRLYRGGAVPYVELSAEAMEGWSEDPSDPTLFAAVNENSAEAMRAMVSLRPKDSHGWYLLGTYEKDSSRQEGAFRKAIELNPEDAQALNALAWTLALAGRDHEALPLANRALDLRPWNSTIVDTLARIALDLNRCDDALILERRAQRTAPKAEWARKNLEEMQARCGAHTASTR